MIIGQNVCMLLLTDAIIMGWSRCKKQNGRSAVRGGRLNCGIKRVKLALYFF